MPSDDSLFPAAEAPSEPNPCRRLYGKGPFGKKCRTCSHLIPGEAGHSKQWYKCDLRRDPGNPKSLGGPSTDHRVRWNACGKYEEVSE